MAARIRIRDAGGTLRTVARIRMRDGAGTLRTIQRIRVRDAGGTLRTVFDYFTVSVSPTTILETGSTGTITTGTAAVVTTTGGTAPISYLWSLEFGDFISITSPTSASTTFRKATMLSGDTYIASFICTATDANGIVRTTMPVDVTISRI